MNASIPGAVRQAWANNSRSLQYILAIILIVYIITAKGYPEIPDTASSIKTAEAIILHGCLDIPSHRGSTSQGPDGRSYSKYGVGLPIYYLPWVITGQFIHRATGASSAEWNGFLISFSNIPFAILTLYLFAWLLRFLKISERAIVLLVIAVGVGSLCWRYAVYGFSEAIQTSLLLLSVFGVWRQTRKGVLVGGLGFATLILIKLAHTALLPVFLIYLLVRAYQPLYRRIYETLVFAAPILLALGIIAALNRLRFGNPIESGYGSEASQFVVSQIEWTVPKLLVSFDKGLFVFCPVLILGFFGWIPFFRKCPYEAALCAMIILVYILMAGAWYGWGGGWCWGPRFLVPTIPILLLPAAFWLDKLSRSRIGVAIFLTAVSIICQIPGVLVSDHQIHYIKDILLTPKERATAMSDAGMAWSLLRHKLTAVDGLEIYSVSEFGAAGDREVDLTSTKATYIGLNLWTEHGARRLNLQLLRWLPALGLLIIGIYVIRLVRCIRV
jgi:hypothetical protein